MAVFGVVYVVVVLGAGVCAGCENTAKREGK
jgi:predicted small secreted protein